MKTIKTRPEVAGPIVEDPVVDPVANQARFTRDGADPGLFDSVAGALDAIGAAPAARARDATLAGAWRILAEMGFTPVIDLCASYTYYPPYARVQKDYNDPKTTMPAYPPSQVNEKDLKSLVAYLSGLK